jgi:hypothetical protein
LGDCIPALGRLESSTEVTLFQPLERLVALLVHTPMRLFEAELGQLTDGLIFYRVAYQRPSRPA